MKLLAIVGSPRPKGNTNFLVDQCLDEAAKQGLQTEKIVLGQFKVGPCLGHENCASLESCLIKDDTAMILDKLCEADAVILATPVYYYNVTAQMKAFIDRNYYLYKKDKRARAKAVGIIVVAEIEGIEDTLHTMNQFVDWSFDVGPEKRFTVSGYASRIGDVQKNTDMVEQSRNLGRRIADSLSP